MNRRQFLVTTSGAALAFAAPAVVTVLYDDRTIAIDRTRADPNDLWVRATELPRINQFEVKPQGACRADLCVPIPKSLRSGEWFNLTGFARHIHQSFVADSGVWSFGGDPGRAGRFLPLAHRSRFCRL